MNILENRIDVAGVDDILPQLCARHALCVRQELYGHQPLADFFGGKLGHVVTPDVDGVVFEAASVENVLNERAGISTSHTKYLKINSQRDLLTFGVQLNFLHLESAVFIWMSKVNGKKTPTKKYVSGC